MTARERWRFRLLGLPQPLGDGAVKKLMIDHIAAKFAALDARVGLAAEPTPAQRSTHHGRATGYLDNVRLAAAWECLFGVLMAVLTLGMPVVVGMVYEGFSQARLSALPVAVAMVFLTILPRPPTRDSLGSILRKVIVLAVAALAVSYALDHVENAGLPGPVRGFALSVLPAIVWISTASAALMTVLLVLRLVRDECVDRLLMRTAQDNLVIELVRAAQVFESQARLEQRFLGNDWRAGSEAWAALERLATAAQLVDRHDWYPADLCGAEQKLVSARMRQASAAIHKMRSEFLGPTEGVASQLRDQLLAMAGHVHRGLFGKLSDLDDQEGPGVFTRLRVSLGRLLCDVPLALTPFAVIWVFDLIGFDSPGNQLLRGGLLWVGAVFAIYVALRALDPSAVGKITLSSRFLSILRLSTPVIAAAGGEDEADDEPKAADEPEAADEPDANNEQETPINRRTP